MDTEKKPKEEKQEEEKVPKGKEYTVVDDKGVINFIRDVAEKNHSHLREAKIQFLWRNKKWLKDGALVPGVVKKPPEYLTPLLPYDFIVILNPKYWSLADSKIREAIVDHLLCFCGFKLDKNDNYVWAIQHPVGNEFPEVIRRHGRWNVDLEAVEKAWEEFKTSNKGPKAYA